MAYVNFFFFFKWEKKENFSPISKADFYTSVVKEEKGGGGFKGSFNIKLYWILLVTRPTLINEPCLIQPTSWKRWPMPALDLIEYIIENTLFDCSSTEICQYWDLSRYQVMEQNTRCLSSGRYGEVNTSSPGQNLRDFRFHFSVISKLATLVKGDLKAPFSITTTPKCNNNHKSDCQS